MNYARLKLTKTREITNPTYYVEAINQEFAGYAFDEERAEQQCGHWRRNAFAGSDATPMDLEIGTGVGLFFAHHARLHPERFLVGIEIKFKPLIQSIRRALKENSKNARIVRHHAGFIENLFAIGELNNVYVHHPDPWTKPKKHKHRLLNREFLAKLYERQRPGSFLDFKTDSRDYFFWAQEEFKNSKYKIERYTEDLHHSTWAFENYVTQFEQFYLSVGQPIYYLRAKVESSTLAPGI